MFRHSPFAGIRARAEPTTPHEVAMHRERMPDRFAPSRWRGLSAIGHHRPEHS
jgi:hypothetical protein